MKIYGYIILAAAVALASCSSSKAGGQTAYRGGPPGPGGAPSGQGPEGTPPGQPPAGGAPTAQAPGTASRPGAPNPKDRLHYEWKVEGDQDRRSLIVQEASVVYGMTGNAVEPLWINLVFQNPTDRPIEILWDESSLSVGAEPQKIAPPTYPEQDPAVRTAILPAGGQYARNIDLIPGKQDSPDVSAGARARPEIRVRIIYRELSGKLLSSFSVVLTPPTASL